EEALRRANLELERAVRMKDEFLSSMSHELHTPLTGILGLAEALRYTLPGSLNETQANAVMNIENSGRGLLDLINNLLDISRIEAGKLNVQMDPLALDEICQSSLNAVRSMAMKKKQTVQYSIEPVNLQVMGEARRLKQALVNLLSNAVKYSPENSQLGLQVSLDADSQIANLTVWDHGTGIAPQDMGRLFQPFVQLDGSLTRRTGGTGLGLALVQKLVDLHGGSVHVESTAGEGSRFTVSLPALRQAAASLSAPGTAGQATGAPSASAQAACRCLVSEENPTEAERLVHFLTVLGIEAGLQPAGADLVEQAARTQPDLVFVGIHLPDDGQAQQTLAALKANLATHAIPVVVTSLEDGQANVSLLGAAGGLQAHFSLPDLRHVLERVFSEKAESKPAAEEPAAGAGLAAGQRATVMYVDDNEINRVVMGEFLRSQGFVVITLESGYDFLLRAPQIQPDIVLMDIQMPGMDGLETMRRLRGHTDSRLASAPVIAITALETPGDRERCLAAGANEYLSKPIRMQELSALIRAMTE
ncbi:MAG: response regulator, partial [Chloroflexota bacterium]